MNEPKNDPQHDLEDPPVAGSDAAPPAEEAAREETDDVSALREQVAFYVDQLQRARAELDNYRRRTISERRAHERRATAAIFRAILPIHDNLLKALAVEEQNDDSGTLLDGLRVIAESFQQVLAQHDVHAMETVGAPFDPNLHEAVFQVESDEVPDGHVVEEFERGYLHGKELLRPARVKVARAPAGADEPESP